MKTLLLATASAAALLACGCSSVRSHSGGTAPAAATGFLGMRKTAIDVDTPKAFAGLQRVTVGSFKVGFVERKGERAKAGRGPGGVASATVTLTGVDAATRQQLTDAAYADFLAHLAAAGYDVVDRTSLVASESFAKAKSYPAPHPTDNSALAPGADLVYHAPAALGASLHFFPSDAVTSLAGLFSGNPTVAASRYAQESGVKVLAVNLLVDFANSDKDGGAFSSTSAVAVGQGLSVKAGSGLAVIGAPGGSFSRTSGTVRLGQPVFSADTFGEIIDKTSAGAKSAQYAANAVTAVLGGGTNISREYEVRARPGSYQSVCAPLLAQASRALVEAMAARR